MRIKKIRANFTSHRLICLDSKCAIVLTAFLTHAPCFDWLSLWCHADAWNGANYAVAGTCLPTVGELRTKCEAMRESSEVRCRAGASIDVGHYNTHHYIRSGGKETTQICTESVVQLP